MKKILDIPTSLFQLCKLTHDSQTFRPSLIHLKIQLSSLKEIKLTLLDTRLNANEELWTGRAQFNLFYRVLLLLRSGVRFFFCCWCLSIKAPWLLLMHYYFTSGLKKQNAQVLLIKFFSLSPIHVIAYHLMPLLL